MTYFKKVFGVRFMSGACPAAAGLLSLFLVLFVPATDASRAAASDLTGNGSVSVSPGDSYGYVYGQRSQGGNAVASGSVV